jgi:hypothetical protein
MATMTNPACLNSGYLSVFTQSDGAMITLVDGGSMTSGRLLCPRHNAVFRFIRMMCEKSVRLRRPDAGDGLLDMVAAQIPDRGRVELLRSTSYPSLEQGGDTHQSLPGYAEMCV